MIHNNSGVEGEYCPLLIPILRSPKLQYPHRAPGMHSQTPNLEKRRLRGHLIDRRAKQVSPETPGNSPQLPQGRFRLDIKEYSFTSGLSSPAEWGPHRRGDLKAVWIWHLGTWVCGGLDNAGVHNCTGLFQPKQFRDCV